MEAAETDAPVDIEYRCRRFDNEQTIWIHLIARFVENAHGAKVYQCVFIDITKQKTAQIQLYRERDRYRIIMENSADVIYEYDRKTDTVVFYETIRRGDETEIAKHVSQMCLRDSPWALQSPFVKNTARRIDCPAYTV